MGTLILVIIILMIRIKSMMLIGIMGIMGMAEVIPLLRLTQHGSTLVPKVPKNGIILSCTTVYDKEPQDVEVPQAVWAVFLRKFISSLVREQ
jgi:hypothetical protein